MNIKQLHSAFIMPIKGTKGSGAFDIYMPESGSVSGDTPTMVPLGFAAEVPAGHVALIFPRSGVGCKLGVELNNTCGVIDSDYRGEWKAAIRLKDGGHYAWNALDRILQFLVVPIANVELTLVSDLGDTERGNGGFGSSGK